MATKLPGVEPTDGGIPEEDEEDPVSDISDDEGEGEANPRPLVDPKERLMAISKKQAEVGAKAAPGMVNAILHGVDPWRRVEPPSLSQSSSWSSRTTHAMQAQSQIGWRAAALGLLALEWEEIQSACLKSLQSRKSPRRLFVELIRKLWDVSWDMWSYQNCQLTLSKEGEFTEAITQLIARVEWHVQQAARAPQRHTLPTTAHPLMPESTKLTSANVDAVLTWLTTMTAAREMGVGGTTLLCDSAPDHNILRQLRQGGLLRRLRKSKRPPRLRTSTNPTDSAPLDATSRDWDEDSLDDLPVSNDSSGPLSLFPCNL